MHLQRDESQVRMGRGLPPKSGTSGGLCHSQNHNWTGAGGHPCTEYVITSYKGRDRCPSGKDGYPSECGGGGVKVFPGQTGEVKQYEG